MNELDIWKQQQEIQADSQSRLQGEAGETQKQMVAPQLREQMAEAQAAVIAQTNPSRALKVILEGFRGNIQDPDSPDRFTKIGYPLMNEKGIARIASMLIPFVNDPIRFGDIQKAEVRDLSLRIANDITEDIGLNWREYGILEPSTKDIIIDALVTLIFITLTRSEGGGERSFLSKVILESVGTQQKPKKKESMWEKYFKV
jgi:hypothetical protein